SGDVTPGGAIPLPHLTSGTPVARAFSRVMTTTRSRPIQPEYQLKFTSNVPNMALVSQGSFDFHLYAPGPSSRAKDTIPWAAAVSATFAGIASSRLATTERTIGDRPNLVSGCART